MTLINNANFVMMQEAMEDDDFANRLVFSDEASFHLNGKLNRHIRMWGTEQRNSVECEHNSLKLNVFGALSKTKQGCFSSLRIL